MTQGWTREQIETRVDELKREHEGKEFAKAVKRFAAESLDPDERDVLQGVLLERAGEAARHNEEVDDRLHWGGWFRRTLRKLEESADPQKRRPRP
jgi:hypothetical protein